MIRITIFYFLIFIHSCFGQNWLIPKDTISKKRFCTVAGIEFGLASASVIGTWQVWYKKQELTKIHSFDDLNEWGGMDKIGHAYTANKITGLSTKMAKWSGLSPKKSRLYGFVVASSFQLSVEIMDGFSKDWGFSWADIGANTAGSLLYVAQDWAWSEQRLLLKFSYSNSPYAKFRPNVLGSTFSERFLKDYNGQTYWLSANIKSFFPKAKFIPSFLNLAIGHSMDAKLIGDKNESTHIYNTELYLFKAKHEWLLSFDIDFTKIPTKKRWLKTVFNALNLVKIPFPSLYLTNNQLKFKPFYF